VRLPFSFLLCGATTVDQPALPVSVRVHGHARVDPRWLPNLTLVRPPSLPPSLPSSPPARHFRREEGGGREEDEGGREGGKEGGREGGREDAHPEGIAASLYRLSMSFLTGGQDEEGKEGVRTSPSSNGPVAGREGGREGEREGGRERGRVYKDTCSRSPSFLSFLPLTLTPTIWE
jgi:hypothetical protein